VLEIVAVRRTVSVPSVREAAEKDCVEKENERL
jgi:hypothetical protein